MGERPEPKKTKHRRSRWRARDTLVRMRALAVAEILELPVAERIQLVELIWDSIAVVPEAVPISDELKADLEQRLAEFEAAPESGISWEEARQRILQGRWRSE